MPIVEVQSPKGLIEIEVPEGADIESAVSGIMQEMSGQAPAPQAAAAPPAPPREPDSFMSRFGRGAAQASIVPAAQLMSRPLAMLGKATGSEYLQSLPQEADTLAAMLRSDAKAGAPEGIDVGGIAGNIAGSLPAGSLRLAQGAGRLAGLTNLVGSGAATGAALSSTTDAPLAQDVAIGAVAAPIAGGLASAAGKAISGRLRPEAEALRQAGVKLTPGQIMGPTAGRLEEGLSSIPVLGDMVRNRRADAVASFNRAAANKVLEPVGAKLPKNVEAGNETIGELEKVLGQRYETLYPRARAAADPQLRGDFRAITSKAANLGDTQKNQFGTIVASELGRRFGRSQEGVLIGKELQAADSELGRLAAGFKADPNFNNRELGGLLNDMQSALRQSAVRNSPGDVAEELAKTNAAWAQFKRVQDASAKTGSESGVFTPEALLASTRKLDRSKDKGRFARGEALMQDMAASGKAVLGRKVPDSGTPYRSLAALLAAGIVDPTTALIAGSAGAAYSPAGSALIRGALTARPQAARSVGDFVSARNAQIARLLGPAAVPGTEALLAPRP